MLKKSDLAQQWESQQWVHHRAAQRQDGGQGDGDQSFKRSMDQQGSTQGWASGHQVLLLTSAQLHHIDQINISGFFMEVFLKEPRSKQEETIPILDFRNDGKKVIHKYTIYM